MRVMKARFCKSRKTNKKNKESSSSVLRSNDRHRNQPNALVVQIGKVGRYVKGGREENGDGKCLLCDPDWCPVYRKQLCTAEVDR